jgi:hypothetical protein
MRVDEHHGPRMASIWQTPRFNDRHRATDNELLPGVSLAVH